MTPEFSYLIPLAAALAFGAAAMPLRAEDTALVKSELRRATEKFQSKHCVTARVIDKDLEQPTPHRKLL